MKTKSATVSLLASLALTSLLTAAPAQRGPAARSADKSDCPLGCVGHAGSNCPAGEVGLPADPTPVSLSAAAQAALLFQIDEERMARELYLAFGAKWGLRPFEQIPNAEARHEAVLRQLATRAGVTQPATVAGRFDSAEVQQRYDALLALGLESATSALRAAAFVEEQDIADLVTLIAATDSVALKSVAEALKAASGHHLAAFVRFLAAQGATYEPKVLAPDVYQSTIGQAAPGPGRGRGYGPGRM